MSALWSIQKALVARLKADAALMARITGVWDGLAPEGEAMPYLVIGEPFEEMGDVLGVAHDSAFMVHVWSAQAGSSREAYEIAALLDAALAAPLAVEGMAATLLQYDQRNLLIEEDGTRHLAIRYRFLTFGGV